MNGQEIIARLRQNEPALRACGVTHAAVFGSRARGDNRPDSDTDIGWRLRICEDQGIHREPV
jgi:hypothetical protein